MKLKIKVKVWDDVCFPTICKKGDWIDLHSAIDMEYGGPYASTLKRTNKEDKIRKVNFTPIMIPLGVSMELPKGYEAIVNPRSSAFKNFRVIMVNSQGIIDNSFCGDDDQWFFPALPVDKGKVSKGDRVCQFRIVLSQKATVWQRIKNLFVSGVEFVKVGKLSNANRGGYGSTGV